MSAGELTPQLRNVTAADGPALARLVAGFRDHLGSRVPTDPEIEKHLPRALGDPGIEFTCAWLGGEAVGYTQTRFLASVWAGGHEAHLEDLFVVPGARRRSIGRALLRHALARAAERGASRLGLNTNERNEAAQALYRAEGLAPVSHALYPGGRELLWSIDLGGVTHRRQP